MAIAKILAKKQDKLHLGNLDAKRDWGYAPEYVVSMWRMLQQDTPDDFVIGTGEAHSVREFVQEAFTYADLTVDDHIEIDPRYFRPTEAEDLVADNTKARKYLDWKVKIRFRDLVRVMVDADMRKIGLEPIGEGDLVLEKRFPKRWWGVD
jgi:GDPmannose 4,6-dehydratase